jgi:hypothetical protein
MSEIARLDTAAAKQQPERLFANPRAVVDEVLLTRGEKLAALERWRAKVMHELTASDDGMAQPGPADEHNSGVLAELEEALRLLKDPH